MTSAQARMLLWLFSDDTVNVRLFRECLSVALGKPFFTDGWAVQDSDGHLEQGVHMADCLRQWADAIDQSEAE